MVYKPGNNKYHSCPCYYFGPSKQLHLSRQSNALSPIVNSCTPLTTYDESKKPRVTHEVTDVPHSKRRAAVLNHALTKLAKFRQAADSKEPRVAHETDVPHSKSRAAVLNHAHLTKLAKKNKRNREWQGIKAVVSICKAREPSTLLSTQNSRETFRRSRLSFPQKLLLN